MPKKIKIKDLIPDDRNINTGSEYGNSLIEKSLRKFGGGRSILLDKNNRIISGNKTIENAGAIGLDDIEIVESDGKKIIAVKRTDIDLNTKRGRELAIADNLTQKHSFSEDKIISEEILTEFSITEDWGLESQKPSAEEDDYQAPPLEEIKTDIVRGDIFEITDGKLTHRLLCGDSTVKEDVEKLLAGNKPNLMITDPPYGVEYDANWRKDSGIGSANATHATGEVQNDNNSSWQKSYSLFPGNVIYTWCASWFIAVVSNDLTENNFLIRALIIWNKNRLIPSRGHYHWKHEPCWYAVRKNEKANWIGDRKQGTIWDIDVVKNDSGHSTQKPVECMARPIRNHSGDVYDPFGGSGTTMVASHQLGRNCYMIEIMPAYCQIIIDRILKLDPSLKITKNGKPFKAPTNNAGQETGKPSSKGQSVKTAPKEAEING